MDFEGMTEKERFRAYSPELSLLLWAVWAPIPAGVPLDEYASYVGIIWKLLDDHAGAEAVSAELTRISEESIGMAGDARRAAELLTEWWYWRFDYAEELEARSRR